MYLFKTSGATYSGVIQHQKHAFVTEPKNWFPGELILVSKNKVDCKKNEKQIQNVMKIADVRKLKPGESNFYWPGTEGRWKYLIECTDNKRISSPFNLRDIIGEIEASKYQPVMTYKKIEPADEKTIKRYL